MLTTPLHQERTPLAGETKLADRFLPVLASAIRFVVRSFTSPQKRCWAIGGCLILVIAWAIFWRAWGNVTQAELSLHPRTGNAALLSIERMLLFFMYGGKGKFLEDFAVGMLIYLIYVFVQHTGKERFAQWRETSGVFCFWASVWLWRCCSGWESPGW